MSVFQGQVKAGRVHPSSGPYDRPASKGLKKSLSVSQQVQSFLSSLSPFRSSNARPSYPVTVEEDNMERGEVHSESGSEEGWNGSLPAGQGRSLESPNVYPLLPSHGAQSFEAKSGSLSPTSSSSPKSALKQPRSPPKSPNRSVHFEDDVTPNPFLSSSVDRHSTSANGPTDINALQNAAVAATLDGDASASRVALAAFLEAKKHQDMSANDLEVIDNLTRSIRAEYNAAAAMLRNSNNGRYSTSSPLVGAESSRFVAASPARSTGFAPGSFLAVGNSASAGSKQARPYNKRYLGPGRLSRRVSGAQTSGIKPIAELNLVEARDTTHKRRKQDDDGEELVNRVPGSNTPSSSYLASSNSSLRLSMSRPYSPVSLGHMSRSDALRQSIASTPRVSGGNMSRPHALHQSFTADQAPPTSPAIAVEDVGRKRAADLMAELIEDSPVQNKKVRMVINPYDTPESRRDAPASLAKHSIPSPSRGGKQLTQRGTPLRGAAASDARAMESFVPPSPSMPSAVQKAARHEEQMEADDAIQVISPSASPVRVTLPLSTKAATQAPAAADNKGSSPSSITEPKSVFASKKVPEVSFSSSNASTGESKVKANPATAASELGTFPSATMDLATTSTSNIFSPFRPADSTRTSMSSSFRKPATTAISQDLDEPMDLAPPVSTGKSSIDTAKVYPSAKDIALATPAAALPFYAFTFPATYYQHQDEHKAAKEAAMKATSPTFTFVLTPAGPSSAPTGGFVGSFGKSEWTCGTCMLKNPDSVKDKCTICEAARPAAVTAAPTATATTSWFKPIAAADEWTCGTCMLKNPDSAKDKCTVCEASRPVAAQQAASTTKPAPAVATSSWFKPASAPGGWTCNTCMLQNADTAKVKCAVCEAPRSAS